MTIYSLVPGNHLYCHGKDCQDWWQEVAPHNDHQFWRKSEAQVKNAEKTFFWIKTGEKTYQYSMKDLYQNFLVRQKIQVLMPDFYTPAQISLVSSIGPFKEMAPCELMNPEVMESFVTILLKDKTLMRREFRVTTQGQAVLEYGLNGRFSEIVTIEQFHRGGILFSMPVQSLVGLDSSVEARLYLDVSYLEKLMKGQNSEESFPKDWSFTTQKNRPWVFELNPSLGQTTFDYFKTGKAFYFVDFAQVKAMAHDVQVVKNFVEISREMIFGRKEMEAIA